MIEIPLTRGLVAIVDDEDSWVLDTPWKAIHSQGHYYAGRFMSVGVLELMHRLIIHAPSALDVDHRDLDRLNNRRSNLRLCTHMQNAANRAKHSNNTSGFKGVSKHGSGWKAVIGYDSKLIHLGTFRDKEKAARAYDAAALELHGDFARINFTALAACATA